MTGGRAGMDFKTFFKAVEWQTIRWAKLDNSGGMVFRHFMANRAQSSC